MSVPLLLSVPTEDEAMFQASKVHHIGPDRHLTPKVEPGPSQRPQRDPEFGFLRGHALPQSASNAERNGGGGTSFREVPSTARPHPAAFGGHPPPAGEG